MRRSHQKEDKLKSTKKDAEIPQRFMMNWWCEKCYVQISAIIISKLFSYLIISGKKGNPFDVHWDLIYIFNTQKLKFLVELTIHLRAMYLKLSLHSEKLARSIFLVLRRTFKKDPMPEKSWTQSYAKFSQSYNSEAAGRIWKQPLVMQSVVTVSIVDAHGIGSVNFCNHRWLTSIEHCTQSRLHQRRVRVNFVV